MKRRVRRSPRWLRVASAVVVLAVSVPTVLVLPWRWFDPPSTAFISRAKAEGREVQQQWVEWDEISPHLPIAVVAAEDQNFPDHHGFDLKSIRSALEEDRPRPRGASTISQQVAKNLFLWPGHSWTRKGLEAYLTVFIELLWPKQRILEVYLNIAELGPGVFGAEAGAVASFGVPAAKLSLRQAALLAAVLPAPSSKSAADPSPQVSARADWILRQVQQLGGPAYLDGI
jgi:monofunctional biosynthetic peptidoglycan transglycosylase